MNRGRTPRQAAFRFIICLGFVSLFADMTYEGAYSIIGPFLKGLGASALQVGFIAGFGEMLAASLRFFSGKLADRTRAYWPIVTAGYVLNLLAIPALAFVGNWQGAALLIVAERTGKSLRGPARDVLLSQATAEVGHGAGFGLHRGMDQIGAVLGPLVMVMAVAHFKRFGPAFLLLALPAVLAVASIAVARAVYPSQGKPPAVPGNVAVPEVFWVYAAAAGVLAMGFVDFPLLAYHIQSRHIFTPAVIPLLYAGAMGISWLTTFVGGRLFDRFGIAVLAVGIVMSMFTLPLGFLGGQAAVAGAVACWAIGIGIQDSVLRAGIAQVVSMTKRGSAFGVFNGVYGVAWFLGSVAMGFLYGHSLVALVAFGMVLQLAAAAAFVLLRKPLAAARA
ncbi:MAG: MFS transporter [Gemmatimonadales bacterium]